MPLPDNWPTKHLANCGDIDLDYSIVANGEPWETIIPAGQGEDVPLSDAEIAQQQTDIAAAEAALASEGSQLADAGHADTVSSSIVTANLAAAGITRDQLEAVFQTLLGESKSAIPFFEEYALDPSMTSQQWTDFQALPQATKDRLLYDTVRSLAALMRYLTGVLPSGS